jgi:hypothetical protein
MDECRGPDWKNITTHARFTSNPNENIAGFRLEGLKSAEDALSSVLLPTAVRIRFHEPYDLRTVPP